MVLEPQFVVLDEPTERARHERPGADRRSAARSAGQAHDLGYLFISHDLQASSGRCRNRVVVLQQRQVVVEEGPAEAIFQRPREAYTQALLAAALNIEPANSAAVRD
jgi:microcin C transport system ATP-binding protein